MLDKRNSAEELYESLLKLQPVANRITNDHHASEDVVQEKFLDLCADIESGALPPEKYQSKSYLGACVAREAIDSIRGYRPNEESIEKHYRRAVEKGLFEDTPAGRSAFRREYIEIRAPMFARPIPLTFEPAALDGGEDYRLLADMVSRCIESISPNSILVLKKIRGLTWDEIAEHETNRMINDQQSRPVDPKEYFTTTKMVKDKYYQEIEFWQSQGERDIKSFVRSELNVSDCARLLEQFDTLTECVDGGD